MVALTGCSGASGAGSDAAGRPDATSNPTTRADGSGQEGPDQEGSGLDGSLRYVALGDSFTAAPYVPRTDLAEGCLRSSGNYPALVADALGAELTDVSCSGADTAAVRERQQVAFGRGRVRPQLAAVTPQTDLVTVGIGGNDGELFSTVTLACIGLGQGPAGSCADVVAGTLGDPAEVVAETRRAVTATLRAVRRAAPGATVVLVGYPRLVAADGQACPAMPVPAADRPALADLEAQLNEALASAAERAGAVFVDMHPRSRGHEICSADPWVNGRRTDQTRGLAFHPFAEGQQAVADAVVETVADDLASSGAGSGRS